MTDAIVLSVAGRAVAAARKVSSKRGALVSSGKVILTVQSTATASNTKSKR